jgi:outer membrane protein, multidrug efflux system
VEKRIMQLETRRRTIMHKGLMALLLAMTLAGCALGPDYKRPAVQSPQAWRTEVSEARDVANTAWWEQLGDPVLNDLIISALKENRDLKLAAARVEEYEGRLMVTRAGLFPEVGATGQGGRTRYSLKDNSLLSGLIANPHNSYKATLGAAWELDFWGRYRRADEAARADLLSTEDARQEVILSLVAGVASGYVYLLDLDSQLVIAKSTAEARKSTWDLFLKREKGGVVSDLEVSQIKAEYYQAAARIPSIEKMIGQQENALCILLGRNPAPIPRGKALDQLALPAIPAGLPSDLLERRPDIRQAEQNLISANAHIGEAKAMYFPEISLTGAFGWSSSHLSDLFKGSSRGWNYAGGASLPIFSGGAIMGQNKVARAVQKEALQSYQKTIQEAFREVDDSLSNQKKSREQLEAQKNQVAALRDYARIARARYDSGYTSYLEVLNAETSLFEAELSSTQTQGTVFTDLIGLYKAMGGGWVTVADGITAQGEKGGR